MSHLTGRRAHLVGGGIGGLTTALALASQGASVRVFERASEFREVGAGIQITPNAGRVLERLGLGDELSRLGIASEAVVPTDALSGRSLARFDLRKQVPRYRFVHRAALISVLARACAKRDIEINFDMTAVSVDDDGAMTMARTGGQVERTEGCDLLVFADGIRSLGRAHLNGPGAADFTGQVAWRAVVDRVDDPIARIYMAPGRHVVSYPLKGGLLNVVAVQERTEWAEEGWSHPDDPAHLQAAFSDCHESVQGILRDVRKVHLWGLFRHEVADRWVRGRLAILGDAAHPTLPFLAQGANLAIEDGFVLARCCAAQGVEDGLRSYESERRPRVSRAIAAANANASNYHLGGASRLAAHTGLWIIGKAAPNAFLRRLSWLYDHDVTQTS